METKNCSKCNQNKPLKEFNFKIKSKNLRQSACKPCTRKEGKKHYDNNKSLVYEKTMDRRNIINVMFKQGKSRMYCVVCSESADCCLDFHHINPKHKNVEISNMLSRGFSPNSILRELRKCLIVCSNCHRKIHSNLINIKPEYITTNDTMLVELEEIFDTYK